MLCTYTVKLLYVHKPKSFYITLPNKKVGGNYMMYVNVRKVIAMGLVLVALTIICVSVASADSSTWYIKSGFPGLDKTTSGTGSNDISDGGSKVWLAERAHCALTIGAGDFWHLNFDYTATSDGVVKVTVMNYDDKTTAVNQHSIDITSIGTSISEDMSGTALDFNTNENLGLKVEWEADDTSGLTFKYGTDTTLSSPSSDPGYPVPELSTLVLSSIGLLALVGYVAYRRRDR
jgi:hypothetical protein